MGALQIFSFQGKPVRVVDIEGEPHFVGRDVTERLGYANANKAMNDHCKGVTKRYPLETPGGMQETRVLGEPDVLRLILKSNKPEAEEFERLVFEEILPTIRKTGSYGTPKPMTTAEGFLAIAQIQVEFERKQEEHTRAIANLNERVDASTTVLKVRPHNSESITHLRERIGDRFSLSESIINRAMEAPDAPRPAAMVESSHAEGAPFAVYWKRDVTRFFERFVNDCKPVTPFMSTHPYIDGRFRTPNKKEAA